ncbi:unnamed protein product [Lota lota]
MVTAAAPGHAGPRRATPGHALLPGVTGVTDSPYETATAPSPSETTAHRDTLPLSGVQTQSCMSPPLCPFPRPSLSPTNGSSGGGPRKEGSCWGGVGISLEPAGCWINISLEKHS